MNVKVNTCTLLLLSAALLAACSGHSNNTTGDNSDSAYPPWSPINIACLYCLTDIPVGTLVPAHLGPDNLWDRPDLQTQVNQHFNFVIPGYIMSHEIIHPEENRFNFYESDMLLDYAQSNGQSFNGGHLVWHYQIPDWMQNYTGNWSAMMANHIQTIVSRYTGQAASWIVVNEAFDDNNPTNLRNTLWRQNVGDDYIAQAFIAARAADANVDLYYNDYMVFAQFKRNAVLAMVDDFQNRGIPIDGLGIQMHIDINWPSIEEIRTMLDDVVDTGLKIRFTELDITINRDQLYSNITLDLALRQEQRYREVVAAYMEHVPPAQRGGIVVWGVSDADSSARNDYLQLDWPLLFDEYFNQKPALRGFAAGLASQ